MPVFQDRVSQNCISGANFGKGVQIGKSVEVVRTLFQDRISERTCKQVQQQHIVDESTSKIMTEMSSRQE